MLRDDRGMTIMEAMAATLIMVVVTLAIYQVFEYGITSYNYSESRAIAQQETRIAIDNVSRYVRMTEVLIDARENDLTFQVDSDDDKRWETIRYCIIAGNLTMIYTDYIGETNNTNVTTRKLAEKIINTDIFTYYDGAGVMLTNEYERPTKTKRMSIKVVTDDNRFKALQIPTGLTESTEVELRNQR